ncbi:MAG: murein biosynthesis integral membrane protein MurJ [bacterium]|nr:murein biosynthesis integral membrane protein MurJ [bacterium]
MSTEHKHITRAAGVNSLATGLSRILGLLRDMTMSYFFGTSGLSSAFFFAFTIPNTLRRLFGEGAMSSVFVPLFAHELHHNGKEPARRAADAVLTVLTVVLTGITVLVSAGCLLATLWVPSAHARLTLFLTALMMPYCILICLAAVCGAMLNTFGHFSRPALSPVLLNLAIIAAALLAAWLTPVEQIRIYAVAVGVLVGGALQLWLQLPALAQRGFMPRPLWSLTHPLVRQLLPLLAPAIIGVGVVQLNVMVDRIMAAALNARAVSVLFYADRLIEFPLGIFGVALAVALLPTISFCAARDDKQGFTRAIAFSLRQVCFIIVPALVGLLVLAEPIVQLLFQRGQFTHESTHFVVRALRCYAAGLVPFAFAKIIVPAFYARKDTRTPVLVGVTVLMLNVILNLILMRTWLQEAGLALSTTICAFINVGVLLILLRRACGPMGMRAVTVSLARIMVLAAAMAVSVWWTSDILSAWRAAPQLILRGMHCALAIGAGVTVYVLLAYFTRQTELMELLAAYFRKRGSE